MFREHWASRGASFGDLDNDGDIDIVVMLGGPAHVLRNDGGNRNNWIGLILRGTRSNRDGIGAKIKLTSASGKVQYRMVTTTASIIGGKQAHVLRHRAGKSDSQH